MFLYKEKCTHLCSCKRRSVRSNYVLAKGEVYAPMFLQKEKCTVQLCSCKRRSVRTYVLAKGEVYVLAQGEVYAPMLLQKEKCTGPTLMYFSVLCQNASTSFFQKLSCSYFVRSYVRCGITPLLLRVPACKVSKVMGG